MCKYRSRKIWYNKNLSKDELTLLLSALKFFTGSEAGMKFLAPFYKAKKKNILFIINYLLDDLQSKISIDEIPEEFHVKEFPDLDDLLFDIDYQPVSLNYVTEFFKRLLKSDSNYFDADNFVEIHKNRRYPHITYNPPFLKLLNKISDIEDSADDFIVFLNSVDSLVLIEWKEEFLRCELNRKYIKVFHPQVLKDMKGRGIHISEVCWSIFAVGPRNSYFFRWDKVAFYSPVRPESAIF